MAASLPPHTATSDSPLRIRRAASPIACTLAAHAVTGAPSGPLSPWRIDTCPAARLSKNDGTVNGDSRCGPRVSVVRTASALDGERPHATVSDRVRRYLSPEHRDAPGSGCPVAALAVDAARAGGGVSEVFAQGIERNIQRFAQLLADSAADASGSAAPSPQDRARAIHVLATMVGGMVLARATAAAQPALSNELMVTLQTQLTDWLEDDTPSPSDR